MGVSSTKWIARNKLRLRSEIGATSDQIGSPRLRRSNVYIESSETAA